MPPVESHDRWDQVLHWSVVKVDRYGKYTVGTVPEEISVRWVERDSVEMDPKGDEVSWDVNIILDETQPVLQGDIFWLGSLTDVPGTAYPPIPATGMVQVKKILRTKSICRKFERRTALCMRYNDTLPTS